MLTDQEANYFSLICHSNEKKTLSPDTSMTKRFFKSALKNCNVMKDFFFFCFQRQFPFFEDGWKPH